MRRAWLIAVLLLGSLTTGCLGSVDPAEIPQSTLNSKGWSETASSSESIAGGLAEKKTKEYRPNNDDTGATGVIVVTANDVPIFDESSLLPQALEQVEQQRNIELTKTGTTSLSLANLGGETSADVYDFQKGNLNGKAVLFTPSNCDPFVVVVGYGVTGAGGFSTTTRTYQDAKDVSRAVTC